METLLLGLAVLACPVGMGVMMWMMSRGGHKSGGGGPDHVRSDTTKQVADLRAEIDQLKADRAAQQHSGRP